MSREFVDLSIREVKDFENFMHTISASVMSHAMVHYLDPDVVCDDDDFRTPSELDNRHLALYLAWEDSVVEQMRLSRQYLIDLGYPMVQHGEG